MFSRLCRFRRISKIRHYHSGILNQLSKHESYKEPTKMDLPFSSFVGVKQINAIHSHRFSTVSEAQQDFPPQIDFLTFLASTVDKLDRFGIYEQIPLPTPPNERHKGLTVTQSKLDSPNHCWLNKFEESNRPFTRDGAFLVLAGVFHGDSLVLGSDHVHMFEMVKYLQHRYPQLCVFGFQCDSSISSVSSQTHIVQTIMKEYLTFPILLSNKNFSEIKKGAYYLLFKDFKSPMLYYEQDTEIGTISKGKYLYFGVLFNILVIDLNQAIGLKHLDVTKEPNVFSFRNLLLYYPGCISADEDGNRLFLSDTNHHRIIIFDGNGKILDCIGSSPGFEDGDFESAKLLCPAASMYDAIEDCLYLVDSENHAVRRADMGRRTLETVYPPCNTGNRFNLVWSWVLDKLGFGGEAASKTEDFDLEPLVTPWHLMKSKESNLLIINRSLRTLWIMDPASGKIREVVTGYPKILEICEEMIMERVSILKRMFGDKFKHEAYFRSKEGCPDFSLMSSLVTFHNDIIFCDTVGQAVLKLNRESGIISNLYLSNFGILGLPYWLSLPLEKVFVSGNMYQRLCCDHHQCFSVLPGKCEIHVNIDIPMETELVGPLQEECIWRQARGSAAEISGFDDMETSTQKVGVAQQWFDELDNLAFSGSEASVDDANGGSGTNIQGESRVHIRTAINISPGTSEVIIYGALYLKMKKDSKYHATPREENVKRILNIVNHKSEEQGTDACVQLISESSRDITEFVFMKPLNLRLEFDCQDHPKADKANEVVLTDSTIEVNVALK
ncbi:Nhl domain-containing protein [Thalictrum thalictroides]|uniref:Nhl domain-containing protein n=1 Tax=Thalictrum thalictroides TaxID=46969 RepID=A0A7J6WX94_THATH|nr:Nhl domain-containing protein [Thalictrum thalictroides]